jgi:outer membrane usher protein
MVAAGAVLAFLSALWELARVRRAAYAGALIFAGAPSAPSFAAPANQDQRALLVLFVDHVDKGTILAVVRGKEILASVSDLDKAGITLPPGPRETINGTAFVLLSSLAPELTYQFDETNLVLHLTVKPQALATNAVDLSTTAPPPDLVYSETTSAFLNYALSATELHSGTGFTEQGLSIDGGLLDNQVSYDGNRFTRTSSALIFDNRRMLTRLTLGDAIVADGLLAGAANVLGINYAKNFAINPYLITYPLQTLAGTTSVPSTAYVYVNGQLVRTIQLQPGPFNLQNIPVTSGSGNTRVVIRNAFGQEQALQAPFYFGNNQLKQGLSQYNFAFGVARAQDYYGMGDYQNPAGLAFYRYGFTNWLTAGGFAEMEGPAKTGGTEISLSLPYVGQIGLTGAASESGGTHGWAAGAQYIYQTSNFSFGGDYLRESNQYAALSLTPDEDRTSNRYDVFAGTTLFSVNISANYTHLTDRDAGPQTQASLQFSRSISNWSFLSLQFGQSFVPDAPVNNSVLLSLTIPFGARSSATLSAQRSQESWTETAQVQRPLPTDEGFGYALQVQKNNDTLQAGQVSYQAPFGLYQVYAQRTGGQMTEYANLSGGLIYIDGQVFPTRAVQQSYILANVPGVKGATVNLYNNPIGKTNSQGQLLVPNLLPYYGNQVSIDPSTIPIDYDIKSTTFDIAPPYRGGAIVTFPIQHIQVVEGQITVIVAGKPIKLVGDPLTITAGGEEYTSPLGVDGTFYFENLPPGQHPAGVLYAGGTCHFDVVVPKSAKTVIQLGSLKCNA